MAARTKAVTGSALPGRTLKRLPPRPLDSVLIPSDPSLRFPLRSPKNVIDYIFEVHSLGQVVVQSGPCNVVAGAP
ncbi:hypothetical protein R69749_06234 [Paraburkholderia domus]|jgi:hypothetical protein|nr:hypothetical protein R70199_00124 [Paraburkholderia domus]CAE6871410.1 hypothetical protein R69749_06234 [Paraburkholderia domus]CAE6890326.1 hypothetical protein R75471_02341 [Paraburkholderia domus]